jgi:hypothetical protein
MLQQGERIRNGDRRHSADLVENLPPSSVTITSSGWEQAQARGEDVDVGLDQQIVQGFVLACEILDAAKFTVGLDLETLARALLHKLSHLVQALA